MSSFLFYRQLNAMDCGPACLRMVARYYGKYFSLETLRQIAGFSKSGVSLLGISETGEKLGFRTRGVKITFNQLKEVMKPCILHWDQNHFVVLKKVGRKKVEIADPAKGILVYKMDEFLGHWSISKNSEGERVGIALLLEPTPLFYESVNESEQKLNWAMVYQYLKSARFQIFQVVIALLFTSALQMLIPFLTQSTVDTGINAQNLQYVTVVLFAQLMLISSQTIVGYIRSRLLLRISNILNIQILSDFWIKLTRLPLSYFDAHQTGDTLQRIEDTKQIQSFLTGTALTTIFSIFNFVIYAWVLIIYNIQLFIIFCIGSFFYFVWVQLFLKFHRKINYQTFHLSAKENNATLQLIQGMQEIRLNNAGKQMRWDWENIQASIFRLNFKSLNYGQLQSAGATLINQVQGIAISFVVAKLVIEGSMTFGAMLAVQYIIGQLTIPIQQWVGFVQGFQDAKIGMERLNEIHQMNDEEDREQTYLRDSLDNKGIQITNLSFAYPGAGNDPVLKEINLSIPANKVTAIVGTSGSGKTTLLKILLKIHNQYNGEILLNSIEENATDSESVNFAYISPSYWRSVCGAVLQDGFIFNDSIARNIAVGEETIDYNRLIHSCQVGNIRNFIETLPNGYFTKLGATGVGLSQGQKQRILISRAIYKNPQFLLFDEATNALDANNERVIVDNLKHFFKQKTVVIVAHRLSTVKNADKIVVMGQGKIIEEGTHEELCAVRGRYYELVKNQLELGN